MSTTISQRELRNNCAAVLRRVAAGESLTITNRGRSVARLVPIDQSVVDQLIADGSARPALSEASWTQLPPAPAATLTSAALLADVRGHDRED